MSEQKIYKYKSLKDDFFDDGKTHEMPDDYELIKRGFFARISSALVYGAAIVFGGIYCRCFLHMKIKGAKKLRGEKGGCFVYGNHTQPIGDVFIPAFVCFPKRIYTVVSPANFSLKLIGKILNPLGALPTPTKLSTTRAFFAALEERVLQKHPIIIYPEAHVWPYYTGIRPYDDTAFRYPDKYGVPAYAMTVTYQKHKLFKKPRMTVLVDGPFYSEGENPREKAKNLRDAVYNCMVENSKQSSFEYVKYEQE